MEKIIARLEEKNIKLISSNTDFFICNFTIYKGNVYNALKFFIQSKTINIENILFNFENKLSVYVETRIKEHKNQVNKENTERRKRKQPLISCNNKLVENIATNRFIDNLLEKLTLNLTVIKDKEVTRTIL